MYEWPPLPVSDPDLQAKRIAVALENAWDRVEKERQAVLSLVEEGLPKEQALKRLRELQAAVSDFQDVAEVGATDLSTLVAGEYGAGVIYAGNRLRRPVRWTLFHRDAVEALATDTYSDFLAASEAAGRTSKRFARVVRKAARETLSWQALGGTAEQSARDFRRLLEDKYRISAIVYRDGSHHAVGEYARMAARTKGKVAFNMGTLNKASEENVSQVLVSDGMDCGWVSHKDSDKPNGTLRTLEEAREFPLAHPNCRRSFLPIPDKFRENFEEFLPENLEDFEEDLDRLSRVEGVLSSRAVSSSSQRLSHVSDRLEKARKKLT